MKTILGLFVTVFSFMGAVGSFMALMATWIVFIGLFFAKVLFTVASVTTTLTWGMIFWVPLLILLGGAFGVLLGIFGTILGAAIIETS